MDKCPFPHEPLIGTPAQEAYQQNHQLMVEMLGRISGRVATSYREERPRTEAHVARQEEALAMLQSALELLIASA